MGEAGDRLLPFEPGNLVDVGGERTGALALRRHGPELDALRPAVNLVADDAGEGAEDGVAAGLLLDLAQGRRFGALAGLELALRQNPVLVLRAVRDREARRALPDPPDDPSGGPDDVLGRLHDTALARLKAKPRIVPMSTGGRTRSGGNAAERAAEPARSVSRARRTTPRASRRRGSGARRLVRGCR